MRDYDCYYFYNTEIEPLIYKMTGNNACWAGLNSTTIYPKTIWIYNHEDSKTKDYVHYLIELINKITPCRQIKSKGLETIRYDCLQNYNKDLILLNFIRYLWCFYANFDNEAFFKALASNFPLTEDKDPMVILLEANKAATSDTQKYTEGHSNIYIGKLLMLLKH